jgi:hypothetical protein
VLLLQFRGILRWVHGPLLPRKATGGRAPQSLSPRIIRTLNAADAPAPRWTTERLARRLLGSIDKRLLVNRDQDDGVHGLLASLARRPGSCTLYLNVDLDARPLNAADIPEPRRTSGRLSRPRLDHPRASPGESRPGRRGARLPGFPHKATQGSCTRHRYGIHHSVHRTLVELLSSAHVTVGTALKGPRYRRHKTFPARKLFAICRHLPVSVLQNLGRVLQGCLC